MVYRDYELKVKEKGISGRYITHQMLKPILKRLVAVLNIQIIGNSVNGLPIEFIKIGKGEKRILFWSQMHGNESTTTKAIFDLLNYLLLSDDRIGRQILDECTIGIIPVLNPDGAEMYTRNNANNIDLNRDALNQTQRESKILRNCFENFRPQFCFNLHGQRTIYSAGKIPIPATVSFLAPTQDNDRSITSNRKIAMSIIVGMNMILQEFVPSGVGTYDDSFNLNCVGDYFQAQSIPTILFEAGHYPNDYDREYVRYLIFKSYMEALRLISTEEYYTINYEDYFKIPQNEKLFFDVIIRNARISDNKNEVWDIAFQYTEVLKDGKIVFLPIIEKMGDLKLFYAHYEVNAKNELILTHDNSHLYEGYSNDFVLMKNQKILLKSEKISIS